MKIANTVRRSGWFSLDEHPFWWLFPVAFLLTVFYFYPVLEVLRLSFTDATLTASTHEYTFDTYRSVFADPALPQILLATSSLSPAA
jgi:multiple sugar transport system permease protein